MCGRRWEPIASVTDFGLVNAYAFYENRCGFKRTRHRGGCTMQDVKCG